MHALRILSAAAVVASGLTAQQAGGHQILRVPGSEVTIRLSGGGEDVRSAVSRDGGATWTEQYAPRNSISLRSRVFDPTGPGEAIPPQLLAGSANRLFYVQFVTEIVPEYRDALLRDGIEVLSHVPFQSYLVRMERGDVARVRRQDHVRAVAEVHLADKIEHSVVAALLADLPVEGRYDLMLADQYRDGAAVEALVAEVGGVLVGPANGGILVTADFATAEQITTVAAANEVLWVEPLGAPENDIDNLRIQAGVNYVEAQIGRDFGQGISGHVLEGVFADHCEFIARPPYRTAPSTVNWGGPTGPGGTSHGTNTAGLIYAAGINPQAKGILPFGQMYYTNYSGTVISNNNRYPLTAALVDPNDIYKCVMQTASWGYPRTTNYTSRSAEMDNILSDFDLFVTQSHGNSGAPVARPQAWAKNVVAVGGFQHFNNANPNDDCHCNTGSTGPAQDGRIGLSFVAYYDNILTTSGGECSYSGAFGGVSGATPIIQGLGGAAIEMWTDGMFGYPGVTWQNRFGARPHYTTTRTLLTVGSRQLAINQATRLEQGWGLPNLQDLYDNRDQILAIDELDVLTQGQSAIYAGVGCARARPSSAPRCTTPSRRRCRMPSRLATTASTSTSYDFDGNVWRGNEGGILTGLFNSPTPNVPTNNDVDVHENVFLQNPAPGIYLVEVNAATITMDNHKETPEIDLDFGLAIRGVGSGRDTSGMTLDIISNAPGQWDFAVGKPARGLDRGLHLPVVQHLATRRARPLTGNHPGRPATVASVGTGAGPGKLLHFTNAAGLYPHATFSWPAAVANLLSGVSVDGFVMLFDASGEVVSVSNVDRETIQ